MHWPLNKQPVIVSLRLQAKFATQPYLPALLEYHYPNFKADEDTPALLRFTTTVMAWALLPFAMGLGVVLGLPPPRWRTRRSAFWPGWPRSAWPALVVRPRP